jgi:hypothetical protein
VSAQQAPSPNPSTAKKKPKKKKKKKTNNLQEHTILNVHEAKTARPARKNDMFIIIIRS